MGKKDRVIDQGAAISGMDIGLFRSSEWNPGRYYT